MKQEMLINVRQPEECRIAIVENGVLEELYVERTNQGNHVGNIYKGVIVNIEPGIQAAFVDYGSGRNGFLHISDVESSYFKQARDWVDRNVTDDRPKHRKPRDFEENIDEDFDFEDGDEPSSSAPGTAYHKESRLARSFPKKDFGDGFSDRPKYKPPIQDVFKRGDEVIVQVIKEGLANKGATLSTYISIPGRYLVLMPTLDRVGVSKKIEDETTRRRLKDIMRDLNPPRGLGFIVRTAGADRSRSDLARDMAYLMRLWNVLVKRLKKLAAPVEIYEESDIIIRTIRDVFSGAIDSIVIDEPVAYERAKEFLEWVMPKNVEHLQLYEGKEPIFHKFGVDGEIARMNHRRVPLKQGGSLVIDQTEALVAIDVNSGNFRSDDAPEETAFQMNLLAAKEIARQIRLRDLGGVIVNDFIDMRKDSHRRQVERTLRDAMRRDKAKTKILRTSPFGLIEMTRQRIRPSLKRSVFRECPCCHGGGVVKSVESMGLEVFRMLTLASQVPEISRIVVTVADEVAEHLNNRKRTELSAVEQDGTVEITIRGKADTWPEHFEIECTDANGRAVRFLPDDAKRK